jgi:hypothetical protein
MKNLKESWDVRHIKRTGYVQGERRKHAKQEEATKWKKKTKKTKKCMKLLQSVH